VVFLVYMAIGAREERMERMAREAAANARDPE